ncbi:MAG: dUTP diphosphatase [Waterburya sp.]
MQIQNKSETTEYFKEIFKLQDSLNTSVSFPKDWKLSKNKYLRAFWVEAGELLDSMGYKWWKSQKTDTANIRLEIIDMFHFLVSDLIIKGYTAEDFTAFFEIEELKPTKGLDPFALVEETVVFAIRNETRNLIKHFIRLCSYFELDACQIYKLYIGKNILNQFRQEQGYKQGSYQKTWNGREDNYVLMEILDSIQLDDFSVFNETVKKQLINKYAIA